MTAAAASLHLVDQETLVHTAATADTIHGAHELLLSSEIAAAAVAANGGGNTTTYEGGGSEWIDYCCCGRECRGWCRCCYCYR